MESRGGPNKEDRRTGQQGRKKTKKMLSWKLKEDDSRRRRNQVRQLLLIG